MWGVATVFLFTRYAIRKTQSKLWLDDLILGISWVSAETAYEIASTYVMKLLLLAQVIVNQLSVNLGLGKHALNSKYLNSPEKVTPN